MTITNGYLTATEFKRAYFPTGSVDLVDDTIVDLAIEAASRLIDETCGRRFWRNTTDETRYYSAEYGDVLYPDDDIGSITTLATDPNGDRSYSTVWAATDFELWPMNAALDGEPYTEIRLTPTSSQYFPSTRRGVKVVGKFGYAATIPAMVKQACQLQAGRIFHRKDAPFGVIGSAEMGQIVIPTKLDPDVAILLAKVNKSLTTVAGF